MLLALLLLTWLQCFVLSPIHQYISRGHGQMGVTLLPQILVIYSQSLGYYFNTSYFVNIMVMECPSRWKAKHLCSKQQRNEAKKANEEDVLDAVSGTPVLQQELNGCRYKVSQVWMSQGSPTTPQHTAQPGQVTHRNRHWAVLPWGIKSTLIKLFALYILHQYLEKSLGSEGFLHALVLRWHILT